MKHVVIFDRDFSTQFFRRVLGNLAESRNNLARDMVIEPEVEYMSHRLAESVIFPSHQKLGNPWMTGDVWALAGVKISKATQAELKNAEVVASTIVIQLGLLSRTAEDLVHGRNGELKSRMGVAEMLYNLASQNPQRSQNDRLLLDRLSGHIQDWVWILSFLPGSDYLEGLATRQLFQIT